MLGWDTTNESCCAAQFAIDNVCLSSTSSLSAVPDALGGLLGALLG